MLLRVASCFYHRGGHNTLCPCMLGPRGTFVASSRLHATCDNSDIYQPYKYHAQSSWRDIYVHLCSRTKTSENETLLNAQIHVYWDDPHTNHLHPRKKNEESYFLRQYDAYIFDGKQESSGPLLSHVGPPHLHSRLTGYKPRRQRDGSYFVLHEALQ